EAALVSNQVTHAEVPSLEAGHRPPGNEGLGDDHRAVADLGRNAARILQLDELQNPPSSALLLSSGADGYAIPLQVLAQRMQGAGVRHLPADVRQVVAPVRMQHEAMMVFVHA